MFVVVASVMQLCWLNYCEKKLHWVLVHLVLIPLGSHYETQVFISWKSSYKMQSILNLPHQRHDLQVFCTCRLVNNFPLKVNSSPFRCAICQTDQAPDEGLSPAAGACFSPGRKPCVGPYLCTDCRKKKDAMEGKRPSRSAASRWLTNAEYKCMFP